MRKLNYYIYMSKRKTHMIYIYTKCRISAMYNNSLVFYIFYWGFSFFTGHIFNKSVSCL